MVLFQPAGDPMVWEFGFYGGLGNLFDIVFWLAAIISAIFALFLLADYLNNRKPTHFYWGISFALLYINTHVLIFSGDFASILDPVPSVLSALTIGFFAVGLFKNIRPESKMGDYLFYYVIIMSLLIGFIKTPYFGIPAEIYTYIVMGVVMALHVPSAVLIVWLPLKTRSENGKSALILPLAAILMSLVGVLLIITVPLLTEFWAQIALYDVYVDQEADGIITQVQLDAFKAILDGIEAQTNAILEPIFTAFPFVYLGAGLCFAWGTFVPKHDA